MVYSGSWGSSWQANGCGAIVRSNSRGRVPWFGIALPTKRTVESSIFITCSGLKVLRRVGETVLQHKLQNSKAVRYSPRKFNCLVSEARLRPSAEFKSVQPCARDVHRECFTPDYNVVEFIGIQVCGEFEFKWA